MYTSLNLHKVFYVGATGILIEKLIDDETDLPHKLSAESHPKWISKQRPANSKKQVEAEIRGCQ